MCSCSRCEYTLTRHNPLAIDPVSGETVCHYCVIIVENTCGVAIEKTHFKCGNCFESKRGAANIDPRDQATKLCNSCYEGAQYEFDAVMTARENNKRINNRGVRK